MATITFAGNLAADPELRFTPNGRAVVRFRVIENRRRRNDAGEWEDDEPNVFRCEAWRSLAEHIAASAKSGQRVTVTGTITTQRWDDKDTGEPRTAQMVTADEVGISLRYHTATAEKAARKPTEQDQAEQDQAEPEGW
jgi:single-strand DNA-binding protein